MIENYKKVGRYVTFVPTNEEFVLGEDTGNNYRLSTPDKKYLQYGFESEINHYTGNTVYRLHLTTKEKLKLVTNAYKLHYEAIYQGERFRASVSEYPLITLFAGTNDYGAKARTNIEGFTLEVGNWVKHVDASEVEIIPVKEPIDLAQFLPKSTG